jgi:hypothetical protein
MSAGRATLYNKLRELEANLTDGSKINASVEVTLHKWSDGNSDDGTEFILKTTVRGWGYLKREDRKELLARVRGINEEATIIRQTIARLEREIAILQLDVLNVEKEPIIGSPPVKK